MWGGSSRGSPGGLGGRAPPTPAAEVLARWGQGSGPRGLALLTVPPFSLLHFIFRVFIFPTRALTLPPPTRLTRAEGVLDLLGPGDLSSPCSPTLKSPDPTLKPISISGQTRTLCPVPASI